MSKSPNRAVRRRVALLGIFAILFQAILFGWHHHDLRFGRAQQSAVVHNSASSTQPADDEDGCSVCQALHHQLASVPGAPAPLPRPAAQAPASTAPVFTAIDLTLAFRARAPPLA